MPIFITSRFRSGSTLLWNIFRHLPGCTAYYEPLNERRWFDAARRGERIDHTHQGVSDYWREYASLAELERYYDERWIDRRLYMDAAHWDAGLMHYIMRLIEAAPGRAALQFNRVDFRLPWLRRYFPQAAIVHLYRHPRAQWYSALMGERRCPRDVTPAQFAPYDELYLLRWCEDLKHQFPFLDPGEVRHPYELSYYLWKLSCLFGATYADLSLCFEELVSQPRKNLAILFDQLQLDTDQLDAVAHLVQQPAKERWRDYADGEWFATYERQCDLTLARFLGVSVSELTGHRATESVPRGG